jgi:hypothetical protein
VGSGPASRTRSTRGQRHDSVHELTHHDGGKASAFRARSLAGRHGQGLRDVRRVNIQQPVSQSVQTCTASVPISHASRLRASLVRRLRPAQRRQWTMLCAV